jgi:superfamily I DNA/RNA helicase
VGTWASSKGLEFKHVFLPSYGIDVGPDPAAADRWKRSLFVAMTRARDTLWLGRVGP